MLNPLISISREISQIYTIDNELPKPKSQEYIRHSSTFHSIVHHHLPHKMDTSEKSGKHHLPEFRVTARFKPFFKYGGEQSQIPSKVCTYLETKVKITYANSLCHNQ